MGDASNDSCANGIPVEEVKLNVHQRLAGGGYGSRGDEATRLALIASIDVDKPVKLIYTRSNDEGYRTKNCDLPETYSRYFRRRKFEFVKN